MSQPSSGTVPRPPRSRTQSLSSDRPSTIALSLMSPPLSVSPEAAFIAASAASQIVTNDHDSHADTWYDQHGIEPAGETALVSPAALQLVNNFLDQLLFNFLHLSRATTLGPLRPAVTEILKPKLAKDAINNADEELREYLGGGDEEDYVQPPGPNSTRDWDVELVWKRTRLRCMVYSSLGDMEEEDEDLYMEQENLEIGANEQASATISPAVAIFLTSVLEYMGELTLTVAGQAAYHRMRAQLEKDLKGGVRTATDVAERIVVEEADMERVALDRTLGRLWRGWKKRIRSPGFDTVGRSFSRASMGHLRQDSNATEAGIDVEVKKPQGEAIAEDVDPSQIALPIGNNDIDEIEVPGLAVSSDDEDEGEEDDGENLEFNRRRPKSLLILPLAMTNDLPTPTVSQPHTPLLSTRKRSNSLPTPGASPYRPKANKVIPAAKKPSDEGANPNEASVNTVTEGALKTAETVEPVEEPTPKANSRAKRPSRIFTGSPTSGTAAMAGITAVAQRSRPSGAKVDEADEATCYERAEIMTSARISVAGSISPAMSDSGGPFSLKRSSSLHSARIIDVVGPKSPSGSRSPSVETLDRMRPVSLSMSRASSLSNQSGTDDPRLSKVRENMPRGSTSQSPVDRMRGSFSNAATISESEEEEAETAMDQKTPRNPSFPSSALATSIPETVQTQYTAPQPYVGPNGRAGSNGRANSIKTTGTTTSAEERRPEIPHKAPSRRAGRNENAPLSPTGSVDAGSVERTKTRDSDEDNTPSRPTHTSGSSASSSTGRLKAVRTSEESSSHRADSMARNFEELIQSNQTITYTLTPENMRAMDSKPSFDGSSHAKGPRRSEDTRMAHSRSRSSSATTEARSISSHHRKAAGLNSHPVRDHSGPPVSMASTGSRATRSASVKARDARVPAESTADFAEFIKSTGPMGENRPAAIRHVSNPSKTSLDSRRVSSSRSSNRARYQPRDAVVDNRTDNSDLIDFIRQGPPSASQNRIPRTVAPFRNTMDSDQMSGAVGGKAVDATIPDIRYSQASKDGTEASMPSIHSSVNSSTALLKNKPSAPPPPSNMFDDEDMMPKRKTRRVKDPYAIDFSDEDDDDLLMTPKPPAKKEESLAEFLRNYDPPPEPVAPPISDRMPKRKASAPSLIGKFTRSGHHSSNSVSSPPPAPPAKEARSLNSRSGFKGYIPLQVNMPAGYDKYGPVDAKPAPPPPMPARAGSSGRVPMKRFEPRDAVSNVSRTSDLASFLRDSEPPPEPMVRPPPPQEQSSSSGLAKLFGRRKKPSLT